MILLVILSIMLLFLIGFLVLSISIGGSVAIVIFADVIVCVIVVAWAIRRLIRRK